MFANYFQLIFKNLPSLSIVFFLICFKFEPVLLESLIVKAQTDLSAVKVRH